MIKYVIIILLTAATSGDKQAVKAKLKAMFNDNVDLSLPELKGKERIIANPSKVYWRLVVDRKALQDAMHVDLSNVTKAKIDAWKAANMENPNHLQVATGNDWRQVLTDAGFEAVPYEWPPAP